MTGNGTLDGGQVSFSSVEPDTVRIQADFAAGTVVATASEFTSFNNATGVSQTGGSFTTGPLKITGSGFAGTGGAFVFADGVAPVTATSGGQFFGPVTSGKPSAAGVVSHGGNGSDTFQIMIYAGD